MKNRNILFCFMAVFSAIALTACGGGGGDGGSSGGSGSGGSGNGNGNGDFVAPDNITMEDQTLTFRFDDSSVLELVFPNDFSVIQVEPNTSLSIQMSYASGKFGGDDTAKDGTFDILEVAIVSPGEWDLNVIWTSTTEATFTGTFTPDSGDPSTNSPVSGTVTITE